MRTVHLCVFDDSISYGGWDASGGWVDRLRSYLHGVTLDSRFQAYHLGIPGNTTGDVLTRIVQEAKAREPHVIIFAVGHEKLFLLIRDFLAAHSLLLRLSLNSNSKAAIEPGAAPSRGQSHSGIVCAGARSRA